MPRNGEQLAVLAEDLVRLKADLILAVNTPAALAAKRATTIPIVFTRPPIPWNPASSRVWPVPGAM